MWIVRYFVKTHHLSDLALISILEDMIQIEDDGYARRNHRLGEIMSLRDCDRRKAVYAFLRGDTPFFPPARRVR